MFKSLLIRGILRFKNETRTATFTYSVNRFCRNASSFKGLVLREFSEPLLFQEMKSKKLKSKEVRVAVHNAAVNTSDLLIVENKYDQNISLPFVPGCEICGEVIEVGKEVETLSLGQRIIGLNKSTFGGFAEECVLGVEDVWPIDLNVSFEKGASLAENYATALLGLNRRAQIDSSCTVLVTAAAGGLGLAAVDLAANVYKSKVIGICGTEDKADLVRERGAYAALKYHEKHMNDKVKEVTNGKGVDVVFDAVGGDVFNNSLECVGHEGKVIVAGFASRVIPHIDTNQLLPKAVSLIGVSLSSYRMSNLKLYRQTVEDVIDMHESGLVTPHVSASFPLSQVSDAFDFIRNRKSTGKIVLDIR